MRPPLECSGLPFLAAVVCLLGQFVAAARADGPPPGVVVKVTEYTLSNGRVIGVQEWSSILPSAVARAAPCEVQGNRKASPCSKCADKAGGCDCVGGCGCEAQAKAVAAPAVRCQTCGAGCTCFGTCVCDREAAIRAAQQARPGRAADPVPVAAAPPVFVSPPIYLGPPPGGYYRGVRYEPMPARGASAGFQFNGPFGGGFGAGACVGNR